MTIFKAGDGAKLEKLRYTLTSSVHARCGQPESFFTIPEDFRDDPELMGIDGKTKRLSGFNWPHRMSVDSVSVMCHKNEDPEALILLSVGDQVYFCQRLWSFRAATSQAGHYREVFAPELLRLPPLDRPLSVEESFGKPTSVWVPSMTPFQVTINSDKGMTASVALHGELFRALKG